MCPDARSTCNHKRAELESLITDSGEEVPVKFVAVTETWLWADHTDAQVNISGFNVSRSDRRSRGGGGVLLYSHENYPISEVEKYDDSLCQCLFAKFDSLKMAIFVVYRPPNTERESFQGCLAFVRDCIEGRLDDSFQVCLTGDLNFPHIDWKCERVLSGHDAESRNSADALLQLLESNLMVQMIDCPTRERNILDIFCTNNPSFVLSKEVLEVSFSDHHLVSLIVGLRQTGQVRAGISKRIADGFEQLNFHILKDSDYHAISCDICAYDWEELQNSCTAEEFPLLLNGALLDICMRHVPQKRLRTSRRRVANALRRRRKRIRSRLRKTDESSRSYAELVDNLSKLDLEIKAAYQSERARMERLAIEKIKADPKYFYSYAKTHSVVRTDIAMMRDQDGQLITGPEKIANVLQDHFSSVYSNPAADGVSAPNFSSPPIANPMTNETMRFTTNDVVEAIGELKCNAAPGPDGVPARLLKGCAQAIAIPLELMWRRSLDEGVVPSYYKLSLVTPLHKKGDRVLPGNYRPVSLTSHIVKVFERVLKKKLVLTSWK